MKPDSHIFNIGKVSTIRRSSTLYNGGVAVHRSTSSRQSARAVEPLPNSSPLWSLACDHKAANWLISMI